MFNHKSDRLVEHITEAFRLGRFSCVPSVARLVDVRLQVLIAYVVVATVNHSSEMAPEPLNAVGENITIGVLLSTVSDNGVPVTQLLQSLVRTQLVSNHMGTLLHKLPDDRLQGCPICLVDNNRTNIRHRNLISVSVNDVTALHHSEHRRFGFSAETLCAWRAHTLVFPFLLSADIHLVALHDTLNAVVSSCLYSVRVFCSIYHAVFSDIL